MNEGAIYFFLQEFGVRADEIRRSGEWLTCKCCLAPWTHGGGEDEHPSFGISISDTGRSVYNCFGCMDKALTLDWLLHTWWLATGSYPWKAAKFFTQYENHSEEVHKVDIKDAWEFTPVDVPPLPPRLLDLFPLLQGSQSETAKRCRRWLAEVRGIPEWLQNYFGLRYSPRDRALVFPLTDSHGRIFVLRFRQPYTKKIWTLPPQRAIPWIGEKPPTIADVGVWFGMGLVDWTENVFLVEGEIDAMRLAALGTFNVVASATSSVTQAQIKALCGNGYILGYDDDPAGKKAHRRIKDALRDTAMLMEIDWKPFNDPGALPSKKILEHIFKTQVSMAVRLQP